MITQEVRILRIGRVGHQRRGRHRRAAAVQGTWVTLSPQRPTWQEISELKSNTEPVLGAQKKPSASACADCQGLFIRDPLTKALAG